MKTKQTLDTPALHAQGKFDMNDLLLDPTVTLPTLQASSRAAEVTAQFLHSTQTSEGKAKL